MKHTPEETEIIVKVLQIPKRLWERNNDGYFISTPSYEFVFEGNGSSFVKFVIRPKGSSDSKKDISIFMNQPLKDYAFDIHLEYQKKQQEERSLVLSKIKHDLDDLIKFSK